MSTAEPHDPTTSNSSDPNTDMRVALVSIPKSGTNLVLAILKRALPEATVVDLMYPEPFRNGESRRDYAFQSNVYARKLIETTPPPVIFQTHATFTDYLMTTLWEFGVKTMFLVRDPRAVAVSFVDYVMKNEEHVAHRYFKESLPDFESRLRVAIMGTDPSDPNQPFIPDLAGAWGRYVRWLRQPDVLQLRYEGLVGARFGGWDDRQRANLRRILDFIDIQLDDEAFEALLLGGTDPRASVTFHKGGIQRWKESFTPEIEAMFRRQAAKVLEMYHYKPLHDEKEEAPLACRRG